MLQETQGKGGDWPGRDGVAEAPNSGGIWEVKTTHVVPYVVVVGEVAERLATDVVRESGWAVRRHERTKFCDRKCDAQSRGERGEHFD